MREGTRNFAVGLTAIFALAALAGLLLAFGELQWLWTPRYEVRVRANSGAGLRSGSQVTLQGVPVGQVRSVTVRPGASPPVEVVLAVDASIDIPAGAALATSSSLLGGGAKIDIAIPADFAPGAAVLAHDGSAVIDANFLSLEERLMAAVEERMGGLSDALASVGRLASSLNDLVTEEPGPEGADTSIRGAIHRLNQVLASAHRAFQNANEFLGDEQMRTDARNAVWKANTLIEAATGAANSVAAAAEGIRGDSRELTKGVLPLLDQMSTTLEQVERVAADAREGRGTIGRLMSNADLYESLRDAAESLRESMDELKLLLRKVREEGLGVEF